MIDTNHIEGWAIQLPHSKLRTTIFELLAENERLATRATPGMKTEADLIAWLDSMHDCDDTGAIVCNWKWEPAQRVISATRAKPVADELLRESLAVFDLMLAGCREQVFVGYENGDGEIIGPRMDALHAKLRSLATTSTEPAAQPQVVQHNTAGEGVMFAAGAVAQLPKAAREFSDLCALLPESFMFGDALQVDVLRDILDAYDATRAVGASPAPSAKQEPESWDRYKTGVMPWSFRLAPNSPHEAIESAMQAELNELRAAVRSAKSAAPSASASPAAPIHDSDCSLHNEPAYPAGPCDCSVAASGEV